jgi:protein arginine kinase activator
MLTGQNGFSINNLLSGLLNFDYPLGDTTAKQDVELKDLQCDGCGLTYRQFSKIGRFGCANCYKTFHLKLEPILKRVHSGNTKHGGKIPKRIGGSIKLHQQIRELRIDLQQAIVNEEFEKAAELRDQIREIEGKIRSYGEGEQ